MIFSCIGHQTTHLTRPSQTGSGGQNQSKTPLESIFSPYGQLTFSCPACYRRSQERPPAYQLLCNCALFGFDSGCPKHKPKRSKMTPTPSASSTIGCSCSPELGLCFCWAGSPGDHPAHQSKSSSFSPETERSNSVLLGSLEAFPKICSSSWDNPSRKRSGK